MPISETGDKARASDTQAEQGHVLWSRAAPAMNPPKTSQLPSKPPGRSQAHAVCQSVVVGRCVSCADHKGDSVRARRRAWQAAFTIGGGGRMMYSITGASVPACGDHSAGALV